MTADVLAIPNERTIVRLSLSSFMSSVSVASDVLEKLTKVSISNYMSLGQNDRSKYQTPEDKSRFGDYVMLLSETTLGGATEPCSLATTEIIQSILRYEGGAVLGLSSEILILNTLQSVHTISRT